MVSFAQVTDSPQTITVDGKLFEAGSSSEELLDASVVMRVQILNPAKSCILYEEQHTFSTLATSGNFNIQVGSAVGDPKRTALDSANSMTTVFFNRSTAITGKTSGGGGCAYTPATEDVRHFRFFVTPSTVGSTSQLSPDMRIDSVPQALVAQTLQGLGKDDVFHTSVTSTQAKLDNLLTTNYTNITDLIGGTSSMYLRNASTGTLLPTRPNDPSSPAAGQLWYDTTSNEIKYYNGTAVQSIGAAGAGISSLTAGSGLSGGTITTSGTIAIAAGGVTNAMLASGIDASKITTGTLPAGVVPTNTDTTKLPLAGGTMTGAITMGANTTFGGFDLLGTGHITMNTQKTITVGRYTGAQETTLISTLTGANAGATWYNSTTNKMMYWNGSAAFELAETTSAGGDITAITTNAGSGLTGGATSGPVTLAIDINGTTAETSVAGADEVLIYDASASALRKMTRTNFVLSEAEVDAFVANNGYLTSVAADSLDFTHLADSMTLDASTNIAVNGTDTLSVTNTGTANSFVVNDQTSDTTPFVVDSAGNVGIGTTLLSKTLGFGGNSAVTIGLERSTSGAGGSMTINAASAQSGVIDQDGGNLTLTSGISTGGGQSSIRFQTPQFWGSPGTSTDSTMLNRFVITPQAVSVGTQTSPYYPFEVNAAINGGPGAAIKNWSGTAGTVGSGHGGTLGLLRLRNASGSPTQVNDLAGEVQFMVSNSGWTHTLIADVASVVTNVTAGSEAGNLQFATKTAGTLGVRMLIDPIGNVGIGTTTPVVSLDFNTRTDAIRIPAGTAAEQPSVIATNGMIRYNTTTNKFEGYENGAWVDLRSPASNSSLVASTGSAAAPSLSFTSETDTGFYNSGTNAIGVSAGGAQVFEFTASALVSPTTGGANILTGNGTAATPTFSFSGDTDTGWFRPTADTMAASTAGSERMRIDSSGNVGIGTTAAAEKLDIQGGNVNITSDNATTLSLYSYRNSNNLSRIWGYAARGTKASPVITNSSDRSLDIRGYSYDGANHIDNVRIWMENDGAQAVGDNPSRIGFYTTPDNTASPAEVMRVTSAGRLGIGTTTPGTLLDVAGAITLRPYGTATGEAGQIIMRELAASGTDTATIRSPDAIGASYALTLPTSAGSSGQVLSTDGTGLLTWVNADSSVAADSLDFDKFADSMALDASTTITADNAEVLTITNGGSANSLVVNDVAGDTSPFLIDASGNIGIGTTAPAHRLHVLGSGSGSGSVIAQFSNSGNNTRFQLLDENGSEPAKIHNGTANGIGVSGSVVSLWTVGLRRVQVTGSGDVGIGTSAPDSKLEVVGVIHSSSGGIQFPDGTIMTTAAASTTGNSSITDLSFAADSDVDTVGEMSFAVAGIEAMRIANNGEIGIGTALPSSALTVVSKTSAGSGVIANFTNSSGATRFEFLDEGGGAPARMYNATGNGIGLAAQNSVSLWTNGSNRLHVNSSGLVGIGTTVPSVSLDFNTRTDAIRIPAGTTAQQPTAANGMIRYNTTNNKFEGYENGAWVNMRDPANNTMLTLATGSAAAPAISFTGDTDTGWFRSSADTLAASTAGTERMHIDSSGNVGIATTTASYKLDVNGTLRAYGITDSSDIRLKNTITPLENDLDKILNLQGVSYYWNDSKNHGSRKQIGLIAQDIEKIYPELVDTDDNGMKSVSYSHLVAPLIEAFKAMYQRLLGVEDKQHIAAREIATLKKSFDKQSEELQKKEQKIKELEAKNVEMNKRLEKIEKLLDKK